MKINIMCGKVHENDYGHTLNCMGEVTIERPEGYYTMAPALGDLITQFYDEHCHCKVAVDEEDEPVTEISHPIRSTNHPSMGVMEDG